MDVNFKAVGKDMQFLPRCLWGLLNATVFRTGKLISESVRILDYRFIEVCSDEISLQYPVSPKCSTGVVDFPVQFYTLMEQVLTTLYFLLRTTDRHTTN